MKKWSDFYKNRVNSTYQIYFEERYKEFLHAIVKCKPDRIREIGCGIASISKYFSRYGLICQGVDKNYEMIKLAYKNCPKGTFMRMDILNEKNKAKEFTISHGVLEHFTDEQIESVLKRFPNSIHYVPLNKYEGDGAFGDERLLPKEYWVERFKIKEEFTFNDGYDFCFKSNY